MNITTTSTTAQHPKATQKISDFFGENVFDTKAMKAYLGKMLIMR